MHYCEFAQLEYIKVLIIMCINVKKLKVDEGFCKAMVSIKPVGQTGSASSIISLNAICQILAQTCVDE